MKRMAFQCTLKSDIIINQKSATVGNQATLDFIPGSNFYGIIANQLYAENGKSSNDEDRKMLFALLHSGKLRFGDAHPEKQGKRALRAPAAMFCPKLESIDRGYIHHALADIKDKVRMKELAELQLKQCRNGFYVMEGNTGVPVEVYKSFAIKSAYDHNMRRSKDEQMYGYQSMNKGLSLIFYLTYDDLAISQNKIDSIIEKLQGSHRVGRSRTAQYGWVEINKLENSFFEKELCEVENESEVVIYADSRLIFLDKYGMPTCVPSPAELGFNQTDDQILWEKSQIRTFQYSPWNFARQAYDTDRYGIEKGSVIVIKLGKGDNPTRLVDTCIGLYRMEGFGDVILNPPFLDFKKDGKAVCSLQKSEKQLVSHTVELSKLAGSNEPLLRYLCRQAESETMNNAIYKRVNEFINQHADKFTKDRKRFASQWSTIRSIALACKDREELVGNLVNPENPKAFLTHGVAKDKWDKSGGLMALNGFMDQCSDHDILLAMINLSSEMAKMCSKKERREEHNG